MADSKMIPVTIDVPSYPDPGPSCPSCGARANEKCRRFDEGRRGLIPCVAVSQRPFLLDSDGSVRAVNAQLREMLATSMAEGAEARLLLANILRASEEMELSPATSAGPLRHALDEARRSLEPRMARHRPSDE